MAGPCRRNLRGDAGKCQELSTAGLKEIGGGKDDDMPEYLTVNEACDLARISRTTFYKLLETDSGLADVVIRIPGLRSMRVPERRFRAWLEGGRFRIRRKRHETPC